VVWVCVCVRVFVCICTRVYGMSERQREGARGRARASEKKNPRLRGRVSCVCTHESDSILHSSSFFLFFAPFLHSSLSLALTRAHSLFFSPSLAFSVPTHTLTLSRALTPSLFLSVCAVYVRQRARERELCVCVYAYSYISQYDDICVHIF